MALSKCAHASAGCKTGFGGSSLAIASASLLVATTDEAHLRGDAVTCLMPEDTVLKALTGVIDEERGREMDIVIDREDREGRNLKKHIKSLFTSTTEEGTRMKQGDYYLFWWMMYCKGIPEFDDVSWPPEKDA